MNRIFFYALFAFAVIFAGCDTFTTEIIDDEIFREKDEIAVVGYLSNQGAVVNLQKSISPINTETCIIKDALVELYDSNKQLATTLSKVDDLMYVTPNIFTPIKGQSYYLSVSAPGFETIKSTPQLVLNYNEINRVELIIDSTNYWREDTIPYYLFGRPKEIELSLHIPNNDYAISNHLTRLLYKYKSGCYEKHEKDYATFTMPKFFVGLSQGVNRLMAKQDTVSYTFRFHDQLTIDSTVTYRKTEYHVLDRFDSVLIQSFIFSDEMFEFFTAINEYSINRYEPFSIIANDIPSNISNNIGYFGSVFINEKTIALPDTVNASVTITF